MSDQFTLCPKCGEEVEWKSKSTPVGDGIGLSNNFNWSGYYCDNCEIFVKPKRVTTEYLRGEEDEKGNQSRRSKE